MTCQNMSEFMGKDCGKLVIVADVVEKSRPYKDKIATRGACIFKGRIDKHVYIPGVFSYSRRGSEPVYD